jgi:hypothetical protein
MEKFNEKGTGHLIYQRMGYDCIECYASRRAAPPLSLHVLLAKVSMRRGPACPLNDLLQDTQL